MLIILVGLSKADRGESTFQERLMIAATSVSIPAINQPHFHRRYILCGDLLNKARQLPRWRIVFTARAAPGGGFLLSFAGGHALREHPHRVGVADAVSAERTTDNVVGEHCFNVRTVL